MKKNHRKAKVFLLPLYLWLEMAVALFFPVLLFPSSWEHEKERQENKIGVTESKLPKSWKSFACFLAVVTQQTFSTEIFLLPCAAEIKDFPIQRTSSRTDFEKKLYYSVLNNILDEVIVHVELRIKTMGNITFAELFSFFTFINKNSGGSFFNLICK